MITVFYSFKGGVGRSMALANVAEIMAARGFDVLISDWDLEAPGLETYFLDGDRSTREAELRPGLVDLLQEYKATLRGSVPASTAEDADQFAMVGHLRLRRPAALAYEITPVVPRSGKLYLLPAGRRDGDYAESYARFVQEMSWQDLYQNWAGSAYVEFLRRDLEAFADIVLIDSRTGVTEHGGVCVNHLADIVIMLTGSNEQNQAGTLRMAKTLSVDEVTHARGGRPLTILPIASRIERAAERNELMRFRASFADRFRNFVPVVLGSPEDYLERTEIPYVPFYAFREVVTAREPRRFRHPELYKAYEALAQAIEELWRQGKSGAERPIQIFISYVKEDRLWLRQLIKHLEALKPATRLQVISDLDLPTGERWAEWLRDARDRADAVLALISADYLASPWCQQQLMRTIDRASAGHQQFFPVLVGHCYWQGSPVAQFQMLPASAAGELQPVRDWSNPDVALAEVARTVRIALTEASGPKAIERPTTVRTSAPVTLPPRPDLFVGRERELSEVERKLRKGAASTVICGMAGVGKTYLAIEVAYRLREWFTDGVLFVDLLGSAEAALAPEQAMTTIIEALAPDSRIPTDTHRLLSTYRGLLAQRTALLVLDNLDQTVSPTTLLPPAPSVAIVTTRRCSAVPSSMELHLAVLEPAESREVLKKAFVDRPPPSDAELDRLAEWCGHLPLALSIVGAFLAHRATWSAEEYLAAVESPRLRSQFSGEIYRALGDGLRRVGAHNPDLLRTATLLCVFSGSFDCNAFSEVLRPLSDPQMLLDQLREHSLLEFDENIRRYIAHPLYRDLGRQEADPEQLVLTQERYAAYFAAVLERCNKTFAKSESRLQEALAVFDMDRANIEAAWGWAEDAAEDSVGAQSLLLRMARAGWAVRRLRHNALDRLHWCDVGLSAVQKSQGRNNTARRDDEPLFRLRRGMCLLELRRYDEALQELDVAHRAYSELGDQRRIADSLRWRSQLLLELGRATEGKILAQKGLEIANNIRDPSRTALACILLGRAALIEGDVSTAHEHNERATAIARQSSDLTTRALALVESAVTFDLLGQQRSARARLKEALIIQQPIKDPAVSRTVGLMERLKE